MKVSTLLPLASADPPATAAHVADLERAGLDRLSGGRAVLGLGASGPQVIEGWHGVPYDHPVGRPREVIDICRQVWRRERLSYDGPFYQIPLPASAGAGTGLGKPLKMIGEPVRADIPVYLAALGAKNVELPRRPRRAGCRCSTRPAWPARSGARRCRPAWPGARPNSASCSRS